jgi:hypothetical protein
MNIKDAKNRIAEHERQVALEAGKTVDEINHIRRVVKDALARRAEIVSKRRNKDGRLREMRARHAREIADLTAEIAAFDADNAIIMHISECVDADPAFVPSFFDACREMDDYERQVWAEYRKQT